MAGLTDYDLLTKQLNSLADDENFFMPVLSNASALLYENLEDINWAGFYLMDKGSLMLGPFQVRLHVSEFLSVRVFAEQQLKKTGLSL